MQRSRKHMRYLILMASITFMAILCELMPSGVLPMMAKNFHLNASESGMLVGIYAISSALFGIPIISLTVEWSRKKLLYYLLLGFSVANFLVAIAPNYIFALGGRILGGLCVGTLWPMITAYGMAMVDKEKQGQAVTIIMSGITVGMCFGLPVMTWLGNYFGFRVAFCILGILLLVITFLCNFFLPDVAGEKKSIANSPFTMLKNKGIILVIVLTFLGVAANYGVYTFITHLFDILAYPSFIEAQVFFGIGSIIAVWAVMKFIDKQFHLILKAVFIITFISMILFYFAHWVYLFHLAFILWGIAFGSLSSTFQTATARQVSEGTAVANAIQSCSFNFAIMLGSLVSGLLLDYYNMQVILIFALFLLFIGIILSLYGHKFIK